MKAYLRSLQIKDSIPQIVLAKLATDDEENKRNKNSDNILSIPLTGLISLDSNALSSSDPFTNPSINNQNDKIPSLIEDNDDDADDTFNLNVNNEEVANFSTLKQELLEHEDDNKQLKCSECNSRIKNILKKE